MRLSKIESDYILQTPKVPVTNRSCVEIYNEDEGVSIRPIVRLEPEYPIVRNPRSETIHERFSKIDLPIESLDAENLLYPCEDYDGDLSVTVSPGVQEQKMNPEKVIWTGKVLSIQFDLESSKKSFLTYLITKSEFTKMSYTQMLWNTTTD